MGARGAAGPSWLAGHVKAVAAGATAGIGSFVAAFADGHLTSAETAGVIGATLLAFIGVLAAPANATAPGDPS